MISYAGFTVERRGSLWIARRKTKMAIWQLAPARTRREIEGMIDRHNASLSWDELIAA